MFSSWPMKSLRFCGVIHDIPRFASRKSESFGQRESGCIIALWPGNDPKASSGFGSADTIVTMRF
jgi:hypothetical protein